MDFVHFCTFCGWFRFAESAAMADPVCEVCGCGLASMRRSELPQPEVSDLDRLDAALPRVPAAVMNAARIGLAAAIAAAAARAGYTAAGPEIAVVAFGVAGLATVPIAVPSSLR